MEIECKYAAFLFTTFLLAIYCILKCMIKLMEQNEKSKEEILEIVLDKLKVKYEMEKKEVMEEMLGVEKIEDMLEFLKQMKDKEFNFLKLIEEKEDEIQEKKLEIRDLCNELELMNLEHLYARGMLHPRHIFEEYERKLDNAITIINKIALDDVIGRSDKWKYYLDCEGEEFKRLKCNLSEIGIAIDEVPSIAKELF